MTYQKILEATKDWLFNNGLQILIIVLVVVIAHYTLKRVIEKIVKRMIVSKEGEDATAETKREDTLIKIFNGTISTILGLVAVLMVLSEIGIDIGPLIAGAGVIGIAVGFGGQYLIRDLITGFFIILENQYRVGDAVKIKTGELAGKVEDITLRKTILRDLDGVVHHVPNGEIATVSNMTQGISRINLNVSVAYNSDMDKVIAVTKGVCEGLFDDEYFGEKLKAAPEFLRVDNLGDSSVEIKIIGETAPGAHWELTGELRKRILAAFNKEGIEIPFPQMVIHKSN